MIEKLVIYLLKKPRVKAALKEIIRSLEDEKSSYQKRLEALICKMKNEPELYQSVLDDLRKNPTTFSRHGKFPAHYYSAVLRLYAQLNNPEPHIDH